MTLDDDGDDAGGLGPPLPPDDRLWRHPSELGQLDPGAPGRRPKAQGGTRAPVAWNLVLLAGLTGAAVAASALAATGTLGSRVVTRRVVEKVAVTPVVSSPMLPGGHSERDVTAVAQRLGPAMVHLDVERADTEAMGSGVLYRDDGLVLTSAHLVDGAVSITALLADGRRLDGQVIGVDHVTDVAVVDLDGEGYPVAVLGSNGAPELGAPVIAIASPPAAEGGLSVTTAVVSALDRQAVGPRGEPLHGLIEIDAPLGPASVGGALVDAYGVVVGLTAAISDPGDARSGWATPVGLARGVADALVKSGHMAHVWLGVEGADLTPKHAKLLGIPGGALVHKVRPGSPADAAGLTADDVISEVDGHPVTSISALVRALRPFEPGTAVTIGYWRVGQHATAEVTLAARPS